MINGLEGIPGSGKSYEATVYHVLETVKQGRLVITNLPLDLDVFAAINPSYRDLIEIRTTPQPVRGTWDADAAGRGEPAFVLFEDRHTEKAMVRVTAGPADSVRVSRPAKTFGHVWDYYSDWRDDKGRGPLFIVDECHVPLPRIGTDPQVVEWFKLHRHFNVDVLLMTQRFRGVNDEIADLMAMLIKVRKADVLGRADHYIRKVHAGYRGAVISTEQRKYKSELFRLYRSHTQGNSVTESAATDVSPLLVKFNRFKRVWLVGTLTFCVYAFWPTSKPAPVAKPAEPAWLIEAKRRQAAPADSPSVPVEPELSDTPVRTADPEPFEKNGIHITGWMRLGAQTVYTFAVSAGGARLFDLRLVDLEKAGYRFDPLGECSGFLRWRNKVRAVTCDAPQLAKGTDSMPVVLAVGGKPVSIQ